MSLECSCIFELLFVVFKILQVPWHVGDVLGIHIDENEGNLF